MDNLPKSKLTKSQKFTAYRTLPNGNEIKIFFRYDDECNNGHNTFSITAEIKKENSFGCLHDDIVLAAPEFKHLIKWHLTSSDGPMHYLSNSLYHANDKDCWGKRKGEEKSWKTEIFFSDVPIPFSKYMENFINFVRNSDVSKLVVKEFPYVNQSKENYNFLPKYSFNDFCEKWYQCPFDTRQEAENFLLALKTCKTQFKKVCIAWGEGKEPDIEKARHAAIWPDAKLEDFTEEKLLARLPALMKEFKKDMEKIGFVY